MRVGLTFAFSGVVGVAIATDSLFGLPERRTSKVNVGALEKGDVNIAVHGHLPILVSEIVKQGQSEEFINLAKKHGAKGIKFYGICCSGLSAMYRYSGVIPLSNAVGDSTSIRHWCIRSLGCRYTRCIPWNNGSCKMF